MAASAANSEHALVSDGEYNSTYVELHCHSAFSFLDGASLPDELAPAALELGYQALALTDHNTVSGSMEFAVPPARWGCGRSTGQRSTSPTAGI